MKSVTFSVDQAVLASAREKARREHRSLNDVVRRWLRNWATEEIINTEYDQLMIPLEGLVESGGTFSRDEMNEG